MNTEKIAARRLSLEEVTKLDMKDRLFVSADTAELKIPGCYVPAFLTKSGEDFDGGSITARTIFQEEVSCLPDDENEAGIYLADENGSVTIEVLQSAGVVLDLALFVPNGDKGALTALYAAARQAFGADVVQIWRQGLKEVPDVKVDIFEEQIPRGRKGATAPSATVARSTPTPPVRTSSSSPRGGSRSLRFTGRLLTTPRPSEAASPLVLGLRERRERMRRTRSTPERPMEPSENNSRPPKRRSAR